MPNDIRDMLILAAVNFSLFLLGYFLGHRRGRKVERRQTWEAIDHRQKAWPDEFRIHGPW